MSQLEKYQQDLKNAFKVPEMYFTQNEHLLKAIAQEEKQKSKLIYLFGKAKVWIPSAAAILVLALFFISDYNTFFNQSHSLQDVSDAEIQQYLINTYSSPISSLENTPAFYIEAEDVFNELNEAEIHSALDISADETLLYQF